MNESVHGGRGWAEEQPHGGTLPMFIASEDVGVSGCRKEGQLVDF